MHTKLLALSVVSSCNDIVHVNGCVCLLKAASVHWFLSHIVLYKFVDSRQQWSNGNQVSKYAFLFSFSPTNTKKTDNNNKRIEEERNENEIETTWHSILETKVNKQIAIVERWLQFCVLSVVATMPTQAVHMYVCVWLSVQESIKHKDNGNVITQPLHVAAVTKQCERIPEPTRILKLKSS